MSFDAVIGHTGFVGGTLTRAHDFAAHFNSKTISKIGNDSFGTVVCAAAPGSMFTANRDPETDKQQIESLIASLKSVKTERFVLISTIAVFANFAGKDDEGSTAFQQELAYGRHRRLLEAFVEGHFANSLIVRLPALFGTGLRKNFIFDLLNPIPTMLTEAKLEALNGILRDAHLQRLRELYSLDPATGMLNLDRQALNRDPMRAALEEAAIEIGFAATQFHHPDTTYQYYNMNRLWTDVNLALQAELSHVHLVSEPLKASEIYHRLTQRDMPDSAARAHHEDMRSRHGDLWGRQSAYLDGAETVLNQLAAFYAHERHNLS